ncbi:hypothetical protein [Flindersiella endophytica]
MAPVTAVPPTPAGPVVRGPRASLWALRVTAVLHLSILALQPLLAGMYLDGDVDAIELHGINAHIVQVLCFAQIVAAIFYAWPGGGRIWPLAFSSAWWFAEGVQLGMGYARILVVHILLGVTIVAGQALFAVWTCRRSARVPRKGRRK